MTLEEEIFNNFIIDKDKLINYGFKLKKDKLIFEKKLSKDDFKAIFEFDDKLSGKIFDLSTNDEYINFRIENLSGFSSEIREEYTNLLIDIRNKCSKKEWQLFAQAKRISKYIEEKYGKDYVGRAKVAKKTENVQDAHEAIRPTSILRTPESIKEHLTAEQYKLYAMIYARAIASLMTPATMDATSVVLDNNGYKFNASGSVMKFDGYLRAYSAYEKSNNELLPPLEEGEILNAEKVDKSQHFTKPPARYSEAKLIKELEELGIGRPSTYATIIDTIVSRGYVELENKAFKPTKSGILTNSKLVEFFDSIINVEYTAKMENELDEIAQGNDTYVNAISHFEEKFEPLLETAYEKMPKIEPQKTGEKCPQCGGDLVIRKGRYGEFVACSNYPECKYIKADPNNKIGQESGDICPNCGAPMVYKRGRFGDFIACSNYPECKTILKDKNDKTNQETGETCPKCGSPMVYKKGRFGPFEACSNYPKCKYIKPKPKKKKVKEEETKEA
jgi:DNA topoisomerase-1